MINLDALIDPQGKALLSEMHRQGSWQQLGQCDGKSSGLKDRAGLSSAPRRRRDALYLSLESNSSQAQFKAQAFLTSRFQ